MSSGVLWRDDWLRQRAVSDRVVPLCLRGTDDEAQGQVVLSEVLDGAEEEEQVVTGTLRMLRCNSITSCIF